MAFNTSLLEKILLLEKQKGYPDRSINGGIDRYVENLPHDEELVAQLATLLAGYGTATLADRQRKVNMALARLTRTNVGHSSQSSLIPPTSPREVKETPLPQLSQSSLLPTSTSGKGEDQPSRSVPPQPPGRVSGSQLTLDKSLPQPPRKLPVPEPRATPPPSLPPATRLEVLPSITPEDLYAPQSMRSGERQKEKRGDLPPTRIDEYERQKPRAKPDDPPRPLQPRNLRAKTVKSPSPVDPPPVYAATSPAQKVAREVEQKPRAVKRAPAPAVDADSAFARPAPAPKDAQSKQAIVKPEKPFDDPMLDAPLTNVKGIGPASARLYARLGLVTIRHMLFFFPRRYDDYSSFKKISELHYGETESIMTTCLAITRISTKFGKEIIKVTFGDETGRIEATFFHRMQARNLKTGSKYVLSGKVGAFGGKLSLQTPDYELVENEEATTLHTGRIVPVYSLTEGLSPYVTRKTIKAVVDLWSNRLVDYLPETIRQRAHVTDLITAVRQAHFPDTLASAEEARRRLAFDEFFLIQLGVLQRRREWQEDNPGMAYQIDPELLAFFSDTLPFTLTGAQQRALSAILEDMSLRKPMSRLLQGDVGSGKTVVAAAALLMIVANGYQGALMAPTEILAEQHTRGLSRMFAHFGDILEANGMKDRWPVPRVRLLSGSLKKSEKLEIYAAADRGEIDIIVGTHAIIQEGINFARLGMAIIDEQHRFGVLQRASLRGKGYNPDMLVMTATPIPRSLALTIYGDLDISVIDEMPPGRQEIKTRWVGPEKRQTAYNFIAEQVQEGRQAFIICPLVEESEKIESKAATVEYERLQSDIFPQFKLGLLHGRMKASEKDVIMKAFRAGTFDILVSTSVVEVGIDIPNATVMLIEGANRFGLSQLHQFRGRVGRGEHQSYCLLLSDESKTEASERLKIIEKTQNGFILAEEDLKLRGPGEFFGTRQSGLPDLKVAKLSDMALLELSRREATTLFSADPYLKDPLNAPIAARITDFWHGEGDLS